MPHFLRSKHGCVYRDGKPPPGGGIRVRRLLEDDSDPVAALSLFVGTATETLVWLRVQWSRTSFRAAASFSVDSDRVPVE